MVKKPRAWRQERGAYFNAQFKKALSDRHKLIEKRDKCRKLYYKEPGGFDAVEPWDGASDIHLPIIVDKIETAVPKIMSAQMRANPFVKVRNPVGVEDKSRAKKVEQFISWAFKNDIPDYYLTQESFERNRLLDGTAFNKIRWDRQYRKTVEIHILPSVLKPGDKTSDGEEVTEYRERTVQELLEEIFKYGDPANSLIDVKTNGKDKFKVEFTETGEKYTADVEFREARRIDEVEIVVKRLVLASDNPAIEGIDFEDILFPYRSRTLQSAKWVAHKTWYPIHVVRKKVADGEWVLTKTELENVLNQKRMGDENKSVDQIKDNVIGETGNTGKENTTPDKKFDPNMVPIWELYTSDFVDGDEYPMDIIMYIPEYGPNIVIGIEYHDEILPHGRRPFISDTYIPVDGRVYGIGMAELLYGINLSLDRTINIINNAMEIKSNPWGIYSAFGLAGNSQILSGIRPGELVPVGDVNAISFPDFGQNPTQLYHAGFEILRGYADSLTFSQSIGGSSNYRNAPRTARGTLALMDAAEEKLSSLVEQSQASSWKEMVRQVVALYAAYVGIDKWYTVTGETTAQRISPRDLRVNWQFEYTGSLTSVNRDVQEAKAERLYMALRVDQLVAQDPRAHQAILRNFINKLSDGDGWDEMVPNLTGEGGYPHPPMEQGMETRILTQGVGVEVLPVDDHARHIAEIEKFKQSEAFSTVPQAGVAMINFHLKQHEELFKNARALQAQGLEGPQGMPQEASEPGLPVEGTPALGGELSPLGGGPQ